MAPKYKLASVVTRVDAARGVVAVSYTRDRWRSDTPLDVLDPSGVVHFVANESRDVETDK